MAKPDRELVPYFEYVYDEGGKPTRDTAAAELDFLTETRMYVGQIGTIALNGYSGFVLGRRYELRYARRADGTVVVRLTHPPYDTDSAWLFVPQVCFDRWWVA